MSDSGCHFVTEVYSIERKFKYAHLKRKNGTLYVYARLSTSALKKILEKALAEKEEMTQIPIIRLKTAT